MRIGNLRPKRDLRRSSGLVVVWYDGRTGDGARRIEPLEMLKLDLVEVSLFVVAPWLRT
jgi:hypothetical protein